MEGVFVVAVVGVLAWMFYMMTFRTRDFIDLMKADQERRQKQAERLAKAARAGFSIARWLLKK